ncbi:MAG: hypothetical protein AAB887_01100, partial [Patescibacteria group bacterium]
SCSLLRRRSQVRVLVGAQHNFIKKNLKQTETGKKMFIRLYELAKSEKNEELMKFCADVLETYEKYDINGHIVWEK